MRRCSTKPALVILQAVMTSHESSKPSSGTVRRIVRRAALAGFGALAAALATPMAAFADTPAAWAEPPHVSGLRFLVLLVLIPGGIALGVVLLVSLPSLAKDKDYRAGQSWRAEGEWFGDRELPSAAEETELTSAEAADQRGGVSGSW